MNIDGNKTETVRKNVSSNLFWRLLERFGAQGVTLIVSIVLARVLDPEVYGTVALVIVITTILQVFVDSGLGTALIQKKDADDLDFSTVFFANIVLCLFIYALLFFTAPFFSLFYENDELTALIRVLGLLVIISGFKNIQNAYVSRNLLFKKYFFATLGGTVVAGICGIWMALSGYGVWALIIQNLVNQTIDTIILWLIVKWRPRFIFSWERLKSLFSYGWKLLVATLLDTIWREIRQLIIGKQYTSEDLAFYNKGEEYPKYATVALNSSIDSVLLPTLSNEQDDILRVKSMTRRAIKVSAFCLWPILVGIAVCGNSFVSLVLTDKWLPIVPFLQVFCIVYAFYPIHTANLNAIKAVGKSNYFLVMEIIKKICGLIIIVSTLWFGVMWIALGVLIGNFVSVVVNSWPNKKLLGYTIRQQIMDVLPTLLLNVIMGCCVYSITFFDLNNLITLIIQIPLGIAIYIIGAIISKNDSFVYCVGIIKDLFGRKTKSQ